MVAIAMEKEKANAVSEITRDYSFEIPSSNIDINNYNGNYPLGQLIRCREELIAMYYTRPAMNELEMELKRKTGILTHEVIDHYMYDKRADDFNLTNVDLDLDLDVQIIYQDESEKNVRDVSSSKQSVQIGPELPISEEVSREADTFKLCRILDMLHGCYQNDQHCARTLAIPMDMREAATSKTIFICDLCFESHPSPLVMDRHLKDEEHYSASEYVLDEDNNTDKDQDTENNDDSDKTKKTKPHLKCILRRSCLTHAKPPNSMNPQLSVFCPRCFFNFGQDVLACATHYKHIHQGDHYIYSLSELVEKKTLKMKKDHRCTDCNILFKKLKDLAFHMEKCKFLTHSPQSLLVFVCPFDDCIFKSIEFFDFKYHVLSHNYFISESFGAHSRKEVEYTVLVYTQPIEFYHIADFDETSRLDMIDEADALDRLLEFMKGHNNITEISRVIRNKKMELKEKIDKVKKPNKSSSATSHVDEEADKAIES